MSYFTESFKTLLADKDDLYDHKNKEIISSFVQDKIHKSIQWI